MVALHNRRQGAAYISVTILFFLIVTQVVSERPQGANAIGDSLVETQPGHNDILEHRQLKGSFVEVGARDLLLTGAADGVYDISTEDMSSESSPSAARRTGNLQVAHPGSAGRPRSNAMVPDAGLESIPEADEEDEEDAPDSHTVVPQNTGFAPPQIFARDSKRPEVPALSTWGVPHTEFAPPPLTHSDGQQSAGDGAEVDPLSVPDVPEISHIEAAMLGADEGRYSHFQELLRLKPKLEEAIESYRHDVASVKTQAHGIVKKQQDVLQNLAEVKVGLKSVDDAEDGAKKESEKETRKLATDSVTNFAMYNKHGVFGDDAKGKWSPEAGKWNIFKDFLEPHRRQGTVRQETDRVEAALAPADSSPTE